MLFHTKKPADSERVRITGIASIKTTRGTRWGASGFMSFAVEPIMFATRLIGKGIGGVSPISSGFWSP